MFLESHEYREHKRWKKIFWKKCENKFFFKHTNVVTIKWEKNARNNLFQNHEYRDQKTMEKNRLEKVRNTFFINTRISCRKIGWKNARKKFSKNTLIGLKKVGKKSSKKVRKHVFFYKHTNIVTKKRGEKREKKIFLETYSIVYN